MSLSIVTSFDPMSPLPPITTILILELSFAMINLLICNLLVCRLNPHLRRPRPASICTSHFGLIGLFRHWHQHRSALVLDQDHQELCRLGTACIPTDDVNIIGPFIKGLSWRQRYFLATLHLHHD